MLRTTATAPPDAITPDLFGFAPEEAIPSSPSPPATVRPVAKAPAKKIQARPSAPVVPNIVDEGDDEDDDDESAYPWTANLHERALDEFETRIAKRMFRLLLDDLSGKCEESPDMFGQVTGNRTQRKQDALIWMFNLNPGGAAMPFEWVCNEIGIDHEIVRRITARNMRSELQRLLRFLEGMLGNEYCRNTEAELLDYVNLDGWRRQ